jgi:hypothetical protein
MYYLRNLIALFLAAVVVLGCGGGGDAPSKPSTPTSSDPPTAPAAGKPVDPSTAGSISGSVSYSGEPGRKARIRMNADPNCAAQHSSPVYAQNLEINENGTLQYAFLFVKAGLEDYAFQPPAEAATLDQRGCLYTPRVLGIQTGQELKVSNSDETTHNINPSPANNRDWNVSQAPKSDPIVRRFARSEIMIPVKCNVHPWMKAYIGVVAHPYFSVTGNDGSYSLQGLPPGEYTVEVWHEKLGAQEQKITVTANQAATLDFDYGG